ncbi:hypothetical protein EOK75_12685 (plasmid) [Pseudorhodobacter turbinis]|uniref:PepSY domain-containing protein n=1 Tax=Pseudorhodobacter turbinis TaxID=2500533 RepID=A0A4V1E127_9RHOB|nr:PepSY domain-containing protein [Pseudorhodobacter turbinis]QCO56674.1 hypothetical protein EOK75_12685 [Pseudorhodobacter turbinis]
MRIFILIFMLLRLSPAWAQAAPEDDVLPDSDFARAAVARGEILPLSALLPRIAAEFPGEVLDIELDLDDDGRFEEYEFEILTPDGRLIEVDVDAATGEITEVGPEDFDDDEDDDD